MPAELEAGMPTSECDRVRASGLAEAPWRAPRQWAWTMASLTSSLRPRSSAMSSTSRRTAAPGYSLVGMSSHSSAFERRLTLALDRHLRRRLGVFELAEDPGGLLRVHRDRARRRLHLPDTVIEPGDPVAELHFWNENLQPRDGAHLGRAARMGGQGRRSLEALARALEEDSRLAGVRAVRAVTLLVRPGGGDAMERIAGRLGFSLRPGPGGVPRLLANIHTWLIMRAFGATPPRLLDLPCRARTELWMSAARLVSLHAACSSKAAEHRFG
jgi:hypothetical protein